MTGEEEDAEFIDELLAGEALAGDGVDRGDRRRADVIVGRCIRGEARGEHRVDVRADPSTGLEHLRWLRGMTPRFVEQERFHIHARDLPLKDGEGLEDITGGPFVQRDREDRPRDHVGGEMPHRRIEGEGLVTGDLLVEPPFVIGDGVDHLTEGAMEAHV